MPARVPSPTKCAAARSCWPTTRLAITVCAWSSSKAAAARCQSRASNASLQAHCGSRRGVQAGSLLGELPWWQGRSADAPASVAVRRTQVDGKQWQPYPILCLVAQRGGAEAVTQASRWREVANVWDPKFEPSKSTTVHKVWGVG